MPEPSGGSSHSSRLQRAEAVGFARGVAAEKAKAKERRGRKRIDKAKQDMEQKDRLKNVSLGTSKINYNDPRITVAWCKRFDVPITKPFAKTLMAKFTWAMGVEPEYRF